MSPWLSGLWIQSATSCYSMTCFVQNLCKWLFICPSILFYWILLDDTKLQISLPVKTGLRQQFFRDRECPLNESEIKPRSSIKRSVGTLMSISKILVFAIFSVFISLTVQYAHKVVFIVKIGFRNFCTWN